MRKSFIGYYTPTQEEFKSLWENGIFAFDANVLLNVYRLSQNTSEALLNIIDNMSSQIWIPHQAALEYQNNRLIVIAEQIKVYDDLLKAFKDGYKSMNSQLERCKRHPFIKIDSWVKSIDELFTNIEKEIQITKEQHPNLIHEDPIRERLTAILDGKIGLPYDKIKLGEIYSEGKTRYDSEIPPGYGDKDKKPDARKYGDLVLWYQIMDKAKETKRPIILIADDVKKNDWWSGFKGNIIGPRHELVEEIMEKANVKFYMYQTDQFMKHAKSTVQTEEMEQAIAEVKDAQNDNAMQLQRLIRSFTKYSVKEIKKNQFGRYNWPLEHLISNRKKLLNDLYHQYYLGQNSMPKDELDMLVEQIKKEENNIHILSSTRTIDVELNLLPNEK